MFKIFFCLGFILKYIHCKEGDFCDFFKNGIKKYGICTDIKNCPKALEEIYYGIYPKICSFENIEPIVCCETNLGISGAKCREYSSSISRNLSCPFYQRDSGENTFIFRVSQNNQPFMNRMRELPTPKGNFPNVQKQNLLTIVGGSAANPKEFPFMAAIGFYDNEIKWLCGGTLISERYVLTAAHCLETEFGNPKYIRLGDINLKSQKDDAFVQDFFVKEIIPYFGYEYPSNYNDIGLLKTNKIVIFNQYVLPACLYNNKEISSKTATAAGWGQTGFTESRSDTLLKVDLHLDDFTECNNSYRYVSKRNLKFGVDDATQICAGGKNEIKDTCLGDSGGPLVIPTPKDIYCMHYLIGVTSFGKACGVKQSPGIYTRVSYYVPWIEDIVWK